MRLNAPRRRGFTLLELIVVVVVLGILAALAVPALSAVTARAGDEADRAAVKALAREAQALASLRGDGQWKIEDWRTAASDLPQAASTLLDNGWTLLTGGDPVQASGQIHVALTADQATAGVAMTAARAGHMVYARVPIVGAIQSAIATGEGTGDAALQLLADPDDGGGDTVAALPGSPYVSVMAGGGSPAPYGVAVTDDGTAVAVGRFKDTATFGGTSVTAAGGWDGFVAVVSPDGAVTLAGTVATAGGDQVKAVAVHGTTAVVTGTFRGTSDQGWLAGHAPVGNTDVFVAAFDLADPTVPTKVVTTGGAGYDFAGDIAYDGATVAVSGRFQGTPSTGFLAGEQSAGGYDVFAAALEPGDLSGRAVYTTGGTGTDDAHGVAVDGSTLAVAGEYTDSPTSGWLTGHSAVNDEDGYVAVLDAHDTAATPVVWVGRANGSDRAKAVAIADGKVVAVGELEARGATGGYLAGHDPVGGTDVFLATFDVTAPDATPQVQTSGGSGYEYAHGLAVDGDTVVASGSYGDAPTVGWLAGSQAIGTSDGWVAAFSLAGPDAAADVHTTGGTGTATAPRDVAVHSGTVIVVGDPYNGSSVTDGFMAGIDTGDGAIVRFDLAP